jgi:uncharacterized protein with HEPN domain
MRPEERDTALLFDMLACCEDIVDFTSGVTYEQFAGDKMRRLATERQLEILGEAANHVSIERRLSLPSVDWSRIVGLRNKLAHDYGEVLAERIWRIASESIPVLCTQLATVDAVAAARRALGDSDHSEPATE